jgi:hypothetical protein
MLVVVGGHSRNIGKTSVVEGLIHALPEFQFVAVKITQFGHGVCSNHGRACGCEGEADHPYALSEEYEPSSTDSGRFLGAGARRSFWLRTRTGELRAAAAPLEKLLAQNENVIAESNSMLELASPDLYLVTLDFSCADFKDSSARYLERADAFVVIDRGWWKPGVWDGRPRFMARPPVYVSDELVEFCRAVKNKKFAADEPGCAQI